ncbi:MAG: bestrophin family protein [Janthinobacterium lividum]
MIVRERENWFRLLFAWRGSVLSQVLFRLIILFLLSVIVVYNHGEFFHYKIPLNAGPFTLIGVALAIFLGFYNNASYDRFWEGRKLWGALLNTTRSLARQAITMSGYEKKDKEITSFIRLLIACVYALNHQLRGTDATADLERNLPAALVLDLQKVKFKPVIILKEMGNWVMQAKAAGRVEFITVTAFDHNLNAISNIIGGCERIISTPIPFTYRVLLHRTVYFYCLLLPFGLVDSIGWMTPVMVAFISYTFIALDAIVAEIEQPFGTKPNDLALNAISRMIESTLLEMAGEPVPDFLVDKKSHLLD